MNNISAFFRKLGKGVLIWLFLLNPGNSHSQTISAPYDLSVIFTNDIIPIVELIWQHNTDAFLFYLVERDGDSVGTATIPFYSESVPCFCTYCYRVYAVYDNGISEPCAPDCTFDSVALMNISPDQLEVWLFPDEASTTIMNIDNIGGEPLQYTFTDFMGGTPPPGFISDVNPATAFLPPGVGADVTVSFDASGYSSGTYYQYLIIESNDPYWLYDSIPCIMHVYPSALLMPPNWLHGDTVNNDILLSWGIDTMNTPPELGFNIYRDSINIAFVPYTGGDTIYYLDVAPDPMCYDYHVSTLFDLSTYTFPGDTGESLYTGPEEVCLVYGTFLPIGEYWSSGSFGSFWMPGQNWIINGQYGNPEPCAEFTWDPILTNYQQSLTSGPINGVYQETKGGPYIDGRFILEFDVKLDDNSASGNEYFAAEVWSNGIWQRLMQFSNSDGSFDWENFEIDISDEAFGHVFKIRFMAEGALSSDIMSWFVDNVNVYRICYPPTCLTVCGTDPYTMWLNWSPPYTGGGGGDEWIMWDDGINVDGIGLTGGGVFSVASHWDADMISQYDGMSITTIRFVPYANVVNTSFTLKVWQGANAGTLVCEQSLASVVAGEWNEVVLTTAVALDVAQELWFGYTCDSPDGENPAGFDAGPGVVGYGDMITLDGVVWDSIANFGFDLNWNIHALLDNVTDHSLVQMTYNEDLSVYNAPAALPVGSVGETSYNPIGLSTQTVTGYRIYWSNNGAGYEYLDFTNDTFYVHFNEPGFGYGDLDCYYVKAVYEDCEANSDEACWLIASGFVNSDIVDKIIIFPNPSIDLINIESSVEMSQLCLLDYSGRILQCHTLQNKTQTSLNVSACEPGIYLLQIDTEKGRFVKKIVITE